MVDQVITKQELIDAQKDAQTLEDVVNGQSGELITTRLGRKVYTLASIPVINAVDRDEIDDLIEPKADKVQVTADLSLKADKVQVTADLSLKADKNYVDNAVGVISTDGSKQYATLALANADIANIPLNKNIFVSEVDNGGYWYKATAGATTLTKSPYDPLVTSKSYTDQKTALKVDGVLGKNLFDKSKVTGGKGLGDTGTIINASTRSVSDFIPVLPNTAYSFTSIRKVCFYDASRNFVQLSVGALANVTTASNAVFMRLEVDTVLLGAAQVELGSAKTAYETYGIFLTQQAFSKIQLNISKQQTDFLHRSSPNLFNSSTSTNGKSISSTTGEIYDRADAVASDFIPVFGSTVYSQTEGNFFAEYDANKVFIKGHPTGITTFTTDINTRFVRVAVRIAALPTYILSRSDSPANYVPYDRWYLDDSIQVSSPISVSKWEGKIWNVMGDSITGSGNSYWRSIAAKNNMTTNNYGIGGTAITVRAAPYDTNAMCVRYADMANNADLITIAGGTNDFIQCPLGSWAVRDNTTIYGAMRQMCEGLIAKYPAATIAGILPPQRYNANVETYAYTFRKLIDVLKECYSFYGIPTLDLSTAVGFFRPYDPANKALYTVNTTVPEGDGLHPNKIAHDKIAVTVAEWLETI